MTVTPQEMARMIQADVDRLVRLHHEVVEKACEMALVGGTCGVSVKDGAAHIDPEVPYGQIHFHQPERVVTIQEDGRGGWSVHS